MVRLITPTADQWAVLKELRLLAEDEPAVVLDPALVKRVLKKGLTRDNLEWLAGYYDDSCETEVMYDVVTNQKHSYFAPVTDPNWSDLFTTK